MMALSLREVLMLMRVGLVVTALTAWLGAAQAPPAATTPGPERFSMRVVASGLAGPWEMQPGPDGRLWVSERAGHRILQIDPVSGASSTAVEIRDVYQTYSQDGVLGLALHPGLLRNAGTDFVYVALTYDADPGPGARRRLVIRRYTYDRSTRALGAPVDLLANLPAGEDHVGGRLVFGADDHLYLTLGDGGFNQLKLYCEPIHAQDLPTAAEVAAHDWSHYQGKVLRIALDGSIPADNPLLDGARSHVYSYGHRNPQGLAVGPGGKLYSSEHGPSMDDELNLIQAGRNYGWPYVAGFQDDRVYVYAEWSRSAPAPCSSLTYDAIVAPPSVPQQNESAWSAPQNFAPPLRTFFTVTAEYRFSEQGNATIAPSGIDIYSVRTGIPGWADSVLVTSLIRGVVYRVTLQPDGNGVAGPTYEYFKMAARPRDVLVSADGLTIYVATDAGNAPNAGSVLAYTYQR